MSGGVGDGPMPGRTTRSELAADHALGLAEGRGAGARAPADGRTTPPSGRVGRGPAPDAVRARCDRAGAGSHPGELGRHRKGSRRHGAGDRGGAAPALVRQLAFWRTAAFAACAAALLLAIGLAQSLLRPPMQPIFVAVLQTDEGRAQAVVNAYADGTVTLVPIERIGVPDGRIIEVWTLQSREQGPVSIGRMDRARTLKLDLRKLARPDAGHLFEMTVEQPGRIADRQADWADPQQGAGGQAL